MTDPTNPTPEARLKLLQDAVNENDLPCLPSCTSLAHAEGCQGMSMTASFALAKPSKT
jgi:hypothetical protein